MVMTGFYDVVADFGVVPNVDSSTQWQNAINAAQATLKTLWVPPGNYIAEGLVVSSQFGGILGAGRGHTMIRTATAAGTMFTISNTFKFRIKDLVLGGKGNAIQTGGALINAVNSHAGDYSDLELADGYLGIVLDNATNCRVAFNKGFQWYGPEIVYVVNGGAAHIINNQLDTSSYGPTPYIHGAPVTVWAPGTSYAAGAVSIANNCYFIAGNGGTSGSTAPNLAPFWTAVNDNGIQWYFLCRSYFHQIHLGAGANSNYVYANDCDGPSSGPMLLSGSSYNRIYGNTLSNGLRSAIDIDAGSHDNYIAGNLVQNFPFRGISENAAVIGNIIKDNHISNIVYDDVRVLGSGGIYSPNIIK